MNLKAVYWCFCRRNPVSRPAHERVVLQRSEERIPHDQTLVRLRRRVRFTAFTTDLNECDTNMLIMAHTLEMQYITLKNSNRQVCFEKRFVNEWGRIRSKCWWFCSSAVMRSWGNVGMRSTRSVLSSPFWCTPWGTCCQTDIKRFPLCSLFYFHGYCIDLLRNSNWYIHFLSNSVVTVFAQVLSETTRRNMHGNRI